MERHTVSRLIGAPPGYVGFDQGGLLTDGVDQHPHCVLLLDEIEKAHPDLFNILLQVMDHGKLTDHNGKQVDFRNVILIMTTNAGAADLAKAADRLHGRTSATGDDKEAINRLFTPEFRNRLDAVIAFGAPAAGGHRQGRRQVRAAARGAARRPQRHDRALGRGRATGSPSTATTRRMGARPLARLIQETIKKPLADEVLFGKLKNGGAVRVIVVKPENGKEALGFEYPEGPVTPKPERDVTNAVEEAAEAQSPARSASRGSRTKPKGPGGGGGRADRAEGAAGQGMTSDVAGAAARTRAGACAPAPPAPARKLSWREKRWQRRRRRRLFEEILGWILVPVICVALYWAVRAGLNAAGTSPTAVIQAIKTLVSGGGPQP